MVKRNMYKKIQHFKKQGFTKAEIIRETGLNKRTVSKYYDMPEKSYIRYIRNAQFRNKIFEPYKEGILEVYKYNDFRKLEKSAVYDYLEERSGPLPGTERSFRNYIKYLIETEQLRYNMNNRVYYPVSDPPYGKQMQIDFGEYRTRGGMKLYIFAAVLSASRYKYYALQEQAFTSMDLINHLLDCFEHIGGIPGEVVIDQDKTMVLSENKGDIIYTEKVKYFIEEMGLKMYVCRKNDPESKGKIENAIKFIKNNFLSVRTFSSIEEAQERLVKWMNRRANGKISLATRRIPKEMLTEERAHLKSIRHSIYRKDTASLREKRKPDNMGQISVSSCRYPVPIEYRDKEVEIYKTSDMLYIYDIQSGEKIREYSLCPVPGTRIRAHDRHHNKDLKIRELSEQLKQLFSIDIWREFVDMNRKMFTRYFRDQYIEAQKKLSKDIDEECLKESIKLCLDNQTYSIANLYDTYRYYHRQRAIISNEIKRDYNLRDIPPSKKEFIVAKRGIGVYHDLVASSCEVQ